MQYLLVDSDYIYFSVFVFNSLLEDGVSLNILLKKPFVLHISTRIMANSFSTFMNLKITSLVLNAKCETVSFMQCSRQCT